MEYKRQIAYFDYMEYGEKKGNGGFCKWEQRNGLHKLEVSISGIYGKTFEEVKIFTRANEELGDVKLRDGCAKTVFTGIEFERNWDWEFSQIRVILSESKELIAEFPADESVQEKEAVKKVEEEDKVLEAETEKEPIVEMTHFEPAEEEEEGKKEMLLSLWEWLEQTHEKICPFGTSEEYFRITVEDIYRLQEEYHVLRNNQFLLHGYYNYKYLILGKKQMDSKEYWLGVPGIYHEREKMAARMYGFEKFEGAKQRYGVGDLGYYLITAK